MTNEVRKGAKRVTKTGKKKLTPKQRKKKKPNPTDATMRNINALKKRVKTLEIKMEALLNIEAKRWEKVGLRNQNY